MVNKLHGEKKGKKTKTKGYIVSNIHSIKLQEKALMFVSKKEALMLKQYADKFILYFHEFYILVMQFKSPINQSTSTS